MQIGFNIETEMLSFIGLVNLFLDIMFVADLIVSFQTAYLDDHDGLLVVQPKKIAIHYFKTWFFIDFVSTVPIDYIVMIASPEGSASSGARASKLVRTLRLFRLMKLVRLLKLQKLRDIIQELEINPGIMSLLRLLLVIFFIAHLLACFWNLVAISNEVPGTSWADQLGESYNATLVDQYVWGVYWTTATMMGVGYGDVSAITTGERVYSILAQTVGAFVFGWILATMTIFNESSDPRTARIDAHVQELKSYMRERKLPKKLQLQVIENLHYVYEVCERAAFENSRQHQRSTAATNAP